MCQALDEMKQDWKEEGVREGMAEGIKALILDNLEEGRSEESILEKLNRRFALEPDAAKEYFDKYAPVV